MSNIDGYVLNEAKRLSLHKFGFNQFKDFWLFGYGSGGFGQVYKLFYIMPESSKIIAQHAHNDPIEFIGESWNYRIFNIHQFFFFLFPQD